MTEGSTNRFSISCRLVRETQKAWLIDTGTEQLWFPKSQGEMYHRRDNTWDLFGEEWLLKGKGLI